MTKHEFIEALRAALSGLLKDDINRAVSYYSECIDDHMDDGYTEADAVAAMGDIAYIAQQIKAEFGTAATHKTIELDGGAVTVHIASGDADWEDDEHFDEDEDDDRDHRDDPDEELGHDLDKDDDLLLILPDDSKAADLPLTCYDFDSAVTDIDISVISDDIVLLPSRDGSARVEVPQSEDFIYEIDQHRGHLTVKAKAKDDRDRHSANILKRFFSFTVGSIHININNAVNRRSRVRLTLPIGSYDSFHATSTAGDIDLAPDFSFESLVLRTVSGDVTLPKLTAGAAEFHTTSGDVLLNDLSAKNSVKVNSISGDVTVQRLTAASLTLTATNGDAVLKGARLTEKLHIYTVSGDIDLSSCDASSIELNTVSGDINGRFLTPKCFRASTVSGETKLRSDPNGTPCYAKTINGDITLSFDA